MRLVIGVADKEVDKVADEVADKLTNMMAKMRNEDFSDKTWFWWK